jgi:hypothetical protein
MVLRDIPVDCTFPACLHITAVISTGGFTTDNVFKHYYSFISPTFVVNGFVERGLVLVKVM